MANREPHAASVRSFAYPDIAEAYEALGHTLEGLVDAGYLYVEQRREIDEKVAAIVKAVEERRRVW